MDYTAKGYLDLLKQSLDFIFKSNQKYNQDTNVSHKKELHYHIFSFSQLLYSLKERLVADFPHDIDKINAFFEKNISPSTDVGRVCKLANEWKHEKGYKTRQHFEIELREPETSNVRQVSKVRTKLPINHKLNKGDLDIESLFESAYRETHEFCYTNKYVE